MTVEQDYIKAGEIAAKAREYGAGLIKPGASWIEVADKIEKKIIELGGGLAFPAQMSLNDVAAHQMPEFGGDVVFNDEVICLDVGVHVNGYVGDTACTIDLSGKNSKLVEASRKALDEALKLVKPGVEIRKIGAKIHEVITSYGFAPINNLSGHGVGQYIIHKKPSIPNYDNGDKTKLVSGQVIAIEPFASAGKGMIYESGGAHIFMLKRKKPVRNRMTRKVLGEIEKFNGLPFVLRWLKKCSKAEIMFALRELRQLEVLEEFPSLVDKNHGLVSQAEHTVIVKEKSIVTTRAS